MSEKLVKADVVSSAVSEFMARGSDSDWTWEAMAERAGASGRRAKLFARSARGLWPIRSKAWAKGDASRADGSPDQMVVELVLRFFLALPE